jgi:hypothetical protein
MPQKKAIAKNYAKNFWVFSFLCIFYGFLLQTFFHEHLWKPASTNLKSAKILGFYTHIDIFHIKIFWVKIALFANCKCKCEKAVHFQTFCKSISYFFATIYHSPFYSYWNSKKSINWSPIVHIQGTIFKTGHRNLESCVGMQTQKSSTRSLKGLGHQKVIFLYINTNTFCTCSNGF